MKAIATIVASDKNLAGFLFEGEPQEFGVVGNNKVMKAIKLEQLISNGFCNSQMRITREKGIEQLGNFKVNELPMKLEINGRLHDVTGEIKVVRRYVKDGENIGFDVVYQDNTKVPTKLRDLVIRCNYFKPYNFCIKRTSGDKIFIASKVGFPSINDLPAVNVVSDKKEKSAGNMKPVKDIKPLKEYKEIKGKKIDIASLYDICRNAGCLIVKLPDETYKMSDGGTKYQYGDGFESAGEVEVAYPYPIYADNKMNVSMTFRKAGWATSPDTGKKYDCYTNINKCIFENGENKFKRIGIAVPNEKAQSMLSLLNESGIKCGVVTEMKESTRSNLMMLMNISKYCILVIDTNDIGLISDDNVSKCILTPEQIKDICLKQFEIRMLNKYVGPRGELAKNLKKVVGPEAYSQILGSKLYYKYVSMSNDELNDVRKAGINIYTGAFDAYTTKEKAEGKEGKAVQKDEVIVQYVYKNFDYSKITAKQLLQSVRNNDMSIVTEYTSKMIGYIDNIEDPREQLSKALEMYNRIDKNLEEINNTLWKHRSAMLIQGRGKYIHTHDSRDWMPDANSRAKNYNVYMNSKVDGLRVKFSGVAI